MKPSLSKLKWHHHYRIIPSVFPPINFFEKLVPAEHMEALWHLESLTNERLLEETGNLLLVEPHERLSGPGASIVMAAFTHIGRASRFSAGDFGVYYAAKSKDTAMYETIFHRERFMGYTKEAPGEINMRVYIGEVQNSLHDIRSQEFEKLHHPFNYKPSQQFAKPLRANKSAGLVYNSVRHNGGECIALFRPSATSIPIQGEHLAYVWNGEKISHVYVKSESLLIR